MMRILRALGVLTLAGMLAAWLAFPAHGGDAAAPAKPAEAAPAVAPAQASAEAAKAPEAAAKPAAAPEPRLVNPEPQNPPAPFGPGPVLVLPITDKDDDGAISDWNLAHIGRCLERARTEKAAALIIELTTDGGSVSIVSEMAAVISGARDVRTIMYVKGRAFSAGALVAMACDDIYMEPGSVVGAATPIVIIPGKGVSELPPEIKEKLTRAVVTEFEAIAHKKGHSAAIAAAMVDATLEVLAVQRKPDGPIELMSRQEYDSVANGPDGMQVRLIQVVNDDKKLLVFTDKDAVRWGFAKGNPADINALTKNLGLGDRQVTIIETTFSELLGRFFSSGWVVSLLIAAAALALYIELNHPSGVAAGFFLLALGLFFWASFIAGTANAVSIILVLVGAVLLAVEIFFFPGFGVPGVVGAICAALGLILARVPSEFFRPPEYAPVEFRWSLLGAAALPVIVGLASGTVLVIILMRFFPKLPLFSRLVLQSDLSGAVVTAADPTGAARPEDLIGRKGVAATNLRPGGSARFDGRLLDVVSDGEWIEAGAAIAIVAADSNRIMVRRA